MIDKIIGDTIVFEAHLVDGASQPIIDAVANLSVVDFTGSAVLVTVAPYTTDGTYQKSISTAGWNKGPVVERWKFTNPAGTVSRVVPNSFRMVGTEIRTTYLTVGELSAYYENIEDYFDGNESDLLNDAFNEINAKLEAIGQKLPIRPKADGFYDQPLRDLNAYAAITRIVSRRQGGYKKGDEKPWFLYFNDMAGSIYKKIETKAYNFDRDYSVAEAKIGIGSKVQGTLPGQMETNWRGGVGTGFTDASFERDWIVEVLGTGNAGEVNECSYQWSNDGGISFNQGYTTSINWTSLQDGVFVRFHRGTGTNGTVGIFGSGDRWTWKTFPTNQVVGGKKTARSY